MYIFWMWILDALHCLLRVNIFVNFALKKCIFYIELPKLSTMHVAKEMTSQNEVIFTTGLKVSS